MREVNDVVKWLGEGAVIPLAVDGKVTGDALNLQVRQWCATKGKGVVTPGESSPTPLSSPLSRSIEKEREN